tara:strand:- start:903 stop:1709 length:807 start_codon:yes stop_codon:yes gene_type:complete
MTDPIKDIFVRVQSINPVPAANIPEVEIDIPKVMIRGTTSGGQVLIYEARPPLVGTVTVPVTQNLGKPIVDMPGCVEAHKDNTGKNENLVDDDPKGVQIFCDAGTPAFTPIDYNKGDLKMEVEPYEPDFKIGPPPPVPETPGIPETPCVRPKIRDPITQQCVDPPEPNPEPVIEQPPPPIVISDYVPELSVVTTTAAIATTAAASALLAKPLADFLMKVFKPAAKKAVAKVQALLGKTPVKPSRSEIIADEYRKKKGLLPLKKKGKKK